MPSLQLQQQPRKPSKFQKQHRTSRQKSPSSSNPFTSFHVRKGNYMEINTITAIGAAGTAIAAALPKEISIKMYDDLAHPSAKELGELVAILPRTGKEIINSFVGLVQEYGKKNTALLAQSVEAKMKSIPEGKLVRPSTNTIIPAGECKIVCVKGLYKSTLVLAY